LSGPDELLQAIPYLLGFHPRDSVVLVGLAAHAVVVTARLNLEDAHGLALSRTVGAMCSGGAEEFVGAVYAPVGVVPGEPFPFDDVADTVASAAAVAGCSLTDLLLVSGQRWWSYVCDGDCCPPDGRPLDHASSTVAAAATYAGLVALPDRAALERTLEPLPEQQRELLTPLIEAAEHECHRAVLDARRARHDRSVKRALFAAARRSDEPRGAAALTDAEAARFGVALTDIAIRDALWMAVDGERLDGRALWLELARRLPGPYDAAALFLYAWACWRAGSGALARTAAERAVASDPDYSAADLLLAALSHGVDPRRMPRLRRR
jgi:hypothetical protein